MLEGAGYNYRIFPDEQGRMNRSLRDIKGGLLVVPQFTLAADTKNGLKPSFSTAAEPVNAEKVFQCFLQRAKDIYSKVESGIFAANMQVALVNDGPVTFIIEN